MTRPNTTDITVILDRSGSMSLIASDMRGGFDSFVRDQRARPGECRITLTQFDNVIETVYTARLVAEVPPLVLIPRGGTALLDAIGQTMRATGERLKATPEYLRPSQVLIMIVTDGEENASHFYTREAIAQMTKHQRERYSWEFMYLGANQDAIHVARDMGIFSNAFTYQASQLGSRALFANASAGIGAYRSAGAPLMSNMVSQQAYDASIGAMPASAPTVSAVPAPVMQPNQGTPGQ